MSKIKNVAKSAIVVKSADATSAPQCFASADVSIHTDAFNMNADTCKAYNSDMHDAVTKNILLNNRKESGATAINRLLARPEGATIEEMSKCRKGVESHLLHLRKRGFTIVHEKNRYYDRSTVSAYLSNF